MDGKKKLFSIIVVALLIASIIIIFQIPKHRFAYVDVGGNSINVTDIITEEESYSQKFYADKKIGGISIKMATYRNELTGEYMVEVGDAISGNVIFRKTIYGKDVIDNGYYAINFPDYLEENHEYYFSIYAIEKKNDTLAIWLGECEDSSVELYKNGELLNHDVCFKLAVENLSNRFIALCILASFFVVLSLILFQNKASKYAIYIFAFLIVVVRMVIYYNEQHLGRYDEMAHLSYLTYVSENSEIVPQFEKMKLLIPEILEVEGTNQTIGLTQNEGVFRGKISNTLNYLGHAPLYYWMLNIFSDVDISDNGVVSINLDVLRLINACIVLLALLIILYIGYTRIGERLMYHLLYVAIISMLPMFSFTAVTINNDNFTILTLAITFLGAIRISEKNYNFGTYILIAIGVCATLMTKLTAGLIIVVAAVITISITIIRDKSLCVIKNKYFLYTMPVYLLVVVYYLSVYSDYGAFQPSLTNLLTEEEFKNYSLMYKKTDDFISYGRIAYLERFFDGFIGQWENGAYGHTLDNKLLRLFYNVFWGILGLQAFKIFSSKKENYLLGAFATGITITVISEYLLSYNGYMSNGHGATQSRYYICTLAIMAMIFINFIEGIRNKITKNEINKYDKIDCFDSICVVLSYAFMYFGWLIYLKI